MSEIIHSKCACQGCGVHLQYPAEAEGAQIVCPQCGQQTVLSAASLNQEKTTEEPVLSRDDFAAPESSGGLRPGSLHEAFLGPVSRTPVSLFYKLGLLIVAMAMVTLPLIYLGLVAAAGWSVYWWATHFTFLLHSSRSGRAVIFLFLAYATPLFVGSVLVFFMVKPLFARRTKHAQPLALNAGAEPLLFSFVTKICQTVGAPFPRRIDVDCQLNAAAGFRRGALSFLSNDLVLTIGLPLVAGLTVRQLAGVLAHEFGHFTQGFGMRLTYIIRSVNMWFARVIYERDAWDATLEEWAQTEDARVAIIIGFARLGVWFSRLLLKMLMWIGHGIGCFMLRQMEYDADSYEIKLAGSRDFEETMRRIHLLGHLLQPSYKNIRTSWNLNRHLPDDFPAYLLQHEAQLNAHQRTQVEDAMGLKPSGWFDTHPSNGDRIRRARQAGAEGVFHLEAPASMLFSNFEALSKQVTLLHYADDIGLPLEMAKFRPVESLPASGL